MTPPAGAWGASSDRRPSPPSAATVSLRPGLRPAERPPGGDRRRPPRTPSRFRPFRLARRWSAAACLLAAALALLLGAGAAQAQAPTSVELVGNTEHRGTLHRLGLDTDHAQAFITGSHAVGYRLTRVELVFVALHDAAIPTYTVSIHSDSSGAPGTRLGTLTQQGSLPTAIGRTQFTTSAGIDLDPNTRYWVVIDVTANPSDQVEVFHTSLDDENPGAVAGWSIANGSYIKVWDTTTWNARSGYAATKWLEVHGHVKSELSHSTLTIPLARAIDARQCPYPGAFSLYADGVKQPQPLQFPSTASRAPWCWACPAGLRHHRARDLLPQAEGADPHGEGGHGALRPAPLVRTQISSTPTTAARCRASPGRWTT